MVIERECFADSLILHDLKADSVGETQSSIVEAAQPVVHRAGFKISADCDYAMQWIAIDRIEEGTASGDTALANDQRVHFRKYQIACDKNSPLPGEIIVGSSHCRVVSVFRIGGREPSGSIEEDLLAHSSCVSR